jgi:hypothetical protein
MLAELMKYRHVDLLMSVDIIDWGRKERQTGYRNALQKNS